MAVRTTFRRGSDWGHGFVGYFTLTADAVTEGWTLAFDGGFTIDNVWGASIVATAPGRYLLRSLEWTERLLPGASVEVGFTAGNATGQADPARLVLAGPDVTTLTEGPVDPGPTVPAISVSDASADEGAGVLVFVVTLDRAGTAPVTLRYTTEAGSARSPGDFTAAAGMLTFAPGQTRQDVRVTLRDDTAIEPAEQLTLRLLEGSGAVFADASAIGTIRDNDAPLIRITDVDLPEGNSGQAQMRFTVTLSQPSTSSTIVRFTTEDGTAVAGEDYVARSGSVTFAAGETAKTIAIAIRGDRLAEAHETFTLRLTEAVRGSIADDRGSGTIRNDDLPRISIADAAPVTEGSPGGPVMQGVLSTRGNQIIDETGAPVRIVAVNWFGMETTRLAPDGLHLRNWQEMMAQMAEQGFNTIRLPFSAQAILEGGTPNAIDYALNPDLRGLSPLQILDRIVDHAETLGMRILLDHHRSAAGDGPNGNGLWYDGRFTEARWIDMWEDLAARYRGNPTVIGADLSNEPFGALWDHWADAAERAGNAILAVNPDWLIVVEGVGVHAGQYYWWGGNLMGARDRPVVLNAPDKLVYSPHDYPESVYGQPHFYAPDFPANLPGVFEKYWGYLYAEGIAPVLLGEWGSRLETPRDRAWFDAITAYLQGDTDRDGDIDVPGAGISFAWWSWNPNSGDTGGILGDDWRTVLARKIAALDPLLPDPPSAQRSAVFEVTLDAPSADPVKVDWRTVAGSATAADYITASGTLIFAPGETRQQIAVLLRPDTVAEAEESFSVVLSSPVGAGFTDRTAIARILDDDWG